MTGAVVRGLRTRGAEQPASGRFKVKSGDPLAGGVKRVQQVEKDE